MSRGETPSVEFLAAHAPSAVHRISVSFKQAGSVNGAADEHVDPFSCKEPQVWL